MSEELKIWNKQVVVDILEACPIPNMVEFGEDRGGDWDLNPVYVSTAGNAGAAGADCLRVIPYVNPASRGGAPPENDGVPVYAVELRNLHGDSRGGCDSDDAELCMLYGCLLAGLKQHGFNVINHHDEIF